MTSDASLDRDGQTVTVRVPLKIRRHGGRKMIIAPEGATPWAPPRARIDNTMVKAIARAFRWRRLLEEGHYGSVVELAEAEKINKSYVSPSSRIGPFSRVRPVENQRVNEKGLHYSGGLEPGRRNGAWGGAWYCGYHTSLPKEHVSGNQTHSASLGNRACSLPPTLTEPNGAPALAESLPVMTLLTPHHPAPEER